MILVVTICMLYVFYGILIFFEDSIIVNHRKVIYWVTCILLIIMAGSREVGIDPDSEVYEESFLNPNSDIFQESVEFTYLIIAQAMNTVTNDVHALFFVYAILGVLFKFIAFRHYDSHLLLMVFVYISFYYELHETCQIRAGVLSGCMLMAIPYIADDKRWKALFFIIIGSLFHLSGLILFPLLLLGNKPLSRYWKIALALSVPFSYVFAGFDLGLEFASELPYIGNKIAVYREIEEKGKLGISSLNLFGPLHLLAVLLFYYMLFWADALTERLRYFPIAFKVFAAALLSYAVFSFIPAIGERMGSMYRAIMVVLFPAIAYTLQPKWCGVIMLILVTFIFFIFSLRDMYGVAFLLPSIR